MVIFSLVATSTHIVFKFYMLVFFDDESCLVLWPFCVVYAGLPGFAREGVGIKFLLYVCLQGGGVIDA